MAAVKPTVQTCVWAEPTLYQAMPHWLEAWNAPWTCRRDGNPRLVADTDECASCPRWEARQPGDAPGARRDASSLRD